MKPIKILFVALQYSYGDPKRGLGFEWQMWEAISHMQNVEAILFPLELMRGKADQKLIANQHLLHLVETLNPDCVFVCLFENELLPEILDEIKRRTCLLGFCFDSAWRFESYEKDLAPHFTYMVITNAVSISKYRQYGLSCIKTTYGCLTSLYRPINLPKIYDVSFVGGRHGNRQDVIDKLRAAGLKVNVFGIGWPDSDGTRSSASKEIAYQEVSNVFNQSRINLNLANASNGPLQQVKGRHFEIPGCSGLQLSSNIPELYEFFEPEREITVYNDLDELIEKCVYFTRPNSDKVAQKIAVAAYKRTLQEHTWELRYREIFQKVGIL